MAEKEYLSDDELDQVIGGLNINNTYKTGDKVLYKFGKITKSSTINSIVGSLINMANGDKVTIKDIISVASSTVSV